MKRNALPFLLVAALFCAVGAYAQGQTSNTNTNTNTNSSSDQSQAAAPDKAQKKAAWENGVKTDCAAEIATGGVCEGKDFSSGLMKCLHENRKKLSDGCKAAVHPHKKGKKAANGATQDAAPAAAPQQAPATNPQ
jgi:hypothetical protein